MMLRLLLLAGALASAGTISAGGMERTYSLFVPPALATHRCGYRCERGEELRVRARKVLRHEAAIRMPGDEDVTAVDCKFGHEAFDERRDEAGVVNVAVLRAQRT